MSIIPIQITKEHNNTVIHLESLLNAIPNSTEIVNNFYTTVTQKFGNVMLNMGIFKGNIDKENLIDVLNNLLSNNNVIVVASITPAPSNMWDVKDIKEISNKKEESSCKKEDSLLNDVADNLLSLYNKRLVLTEGSRKEFYTEKETEYINKIERLIEQGWKIKTLESLDDDDYDEDAEEKRARLRNIKKAKKSYKISMKKYLKWKEKCNQLSAIV